MPFPGDGPDRVAVYGTLQRGASAWHLMEPLVAEQEESTVLPGTLYDTSLGYPALRLDEGPGVPAQVFRLRDPARALEALDDYEGPEYRRLVVELDRGRPCWVYEWCCSVQGMRRLPTWLEHP
jgi:gamma-glutamylcyclotransferase (GGCT)/AIG2-like uncharacterized protein YtfP